MMNMNLLAVVTSPSIYQFPLLQDHNCVPHVVMQKVNPDVGPVFCPLQTPLCQVPELPQKFWGGYPIGPGLHGGGGWWSYPLPMLTLSHSVLTLTVRQQRYHCDIHSVLQSLDLHYLPLPIGWYHPRCSSLIIHHQHVVRRVAWLVCHSHRLPRISL